MRLKVAARLRLWDRVFGWKRRKEAAATLEHASDALTQGAKVLDIGCGMGYALDVLSEDYQTLSFGCDVVASTHRVQRFCIFDGRNVPFADKSVDVALLIFVLHHAEDPSILLREAARIARRAILVVEDTPRTAFDRKWGDIHIRSFSKRHKIPWLGRIRTDGEWQQLFRSIGLPVRSFGRLARYERLPPVARTAYVLQPMAQVPSAFSAPRRTAAHRTTI